ncbi:MAG: SIS domain-containing protein [Bryobacteraceae bacterium]
MLDELLKRPEAEQREAGYYYTLREIRQQPAAWVDAGTRAAPLREAAGDARSIVLTGSGSSLYAGECLAPVLQAELGVTVQAVGGGQLLTHGADAAPPLRPMLMVSLARSGDSPESCAAVDLFLEREPECRHLAITCNPRGRLATSYGGDPRFRALVLDERVNDRSLVMTSSFTSMVVAGRALGAEGYAARVARLSAAAESILSGSAEALAEAGGRPFRRAVYLGSGARFGAAREAGLKVMEMTAGGTVSIPETFLGLRHGPMSAVHPDTMVVAYLSSAEPVRSYELDLIEELGRKRLGAFKVIAGVNVPPDLLGPGDVAVAYPEGVPDGDAPVLDVLVGQLLAFFHCRAAGLKPDAPSESGVITRVVGSFRIHGGRR